MPFFSIVIPVYNRAGLFKQTIQTLFDQEFTDFEIIVIDDGSTDEIKELVSQLTLQHANLKYFYQQNSERGCARNNGIQRAQGRYVVMFDSDDFMHPDHLSTLHANILTLNYPEFIATKFDFVTDGKHVPSDIMSLPAGEYDYRLFLHGNPFACNICFHRENRSLFLFEEDRKYAMLEDWMFLIQNLKNSKIYLVNKVTISQHDHEKRSMKNDNAEFVRRVKRAFDWMLAKVPLSDPEVRILKAQVNYLSAIHCYLDGKRTETITYLTRALQANGFQMRYALLLLKCLAGRKLLSKLKS